MKYCIYLFVFTIINLPQVFGQCRDCYGTPFLGIYSNGISKKKAKALNFENTEGSYITGVIGNTAAEKAGLQPFDYIYGIDEYRTDYGLSLTSILRKYDPGDEVTLHLYRKGKKETRVINLGKRSDAEYHKRKKSEDPFLGVEQRSKGWEDNYEGVRVNIVSNSTAEAMGLEDGDVIQHSMVSKSIERAQKKVEENNFATRKRLLEYDDVMNAQREVIYKRRRHALFGERLQLDIMNMMYETCEDITSNSKGADDFDSFKLSMLGTFGIDYPIDQETFAATGTDKLVDEVYHHVYGQYQGKGEKIGEAILPILKNIQDERGATEKNIIVPFTDGKRQLGVVTDLEEAITTNGGALIQSQEKYVTLGIIDEAWKEHLREMDDLKQSVRNAVYEQKDPLLIYKMEGFELFKKFVVRVNEETVSFLSKANIPVQDPDQVQEARQRRSKQRYQESKEESRSALSGGEQPQANRPPAEKAMPVKSQKVAGRNELVNVQYTDGTVRKGVKFKKVEQDLLDNKCVIVD